MNKDNLERIKRQSEKTAQMKPLIEEHNEMYLHGGWAVCSCKYAKYIRKLNEELD